jgi:hypothetical protein
MCEALLGGAEEYLVRRGPARSGRSRACRRLSCAMLQPCRRRVGISMCKPRLCLASGSQPVLSCSLLLCRSGQARDPQGGAEHVDACHEALPGCRLTSRAGRCGGCARGRLQGRRRWRRRRGAHRLRGGRRRWRRRWRCRGAAPPLQPSALATGNPPPSPLQPSAFAKSRPPAAMPAVATKAYVGPSPPEEAAFFPRVRPLPCRPFARRWTAPAWACCRRSWRRT